VLTRPFSCSYLYLNLDLALDPHPDLPTHRRSVDGARSFRRAVSKDLRGVGLPRDHVVLRGDVLACHSSYPLPASATAPGAQPHGLSLPRVPVATSGDSRFRASKLTPSSGSSESITVEEVCDLFTGPDGDRPTVVGCRPDDDRSRNIPPAGDRNA